MFFDCTIIAQNHLNISIEYVVKSNIREQKKLNPEIKLITEK